MWSSWSALLSEIYWGEKKQIFCAAKINRLVFQKHKKAKHKVCKSWCHSRFISQGWYPDSDQVLLLRKKAELSWNIKTKAVLSQKMLRHKVVKCIWYEICLNGKHSVKCNICFCQHSKWKHQQCIYGWTLHKFPQVCLRHSVKSLFVSVCFLTILFYMYWLSTWGLTHI